MRRGVALILLCCVPPGASYLISFCDFIYTWVFIVFLWWLRSRIRFVEHHNRKHVRASDYTVYVRAGLPKVRIPAEKNHVVAEEARAPVGHHPEEELGHPGPGHIHPHKH